MARMNDDYERRRGPVKKTVTTGGGLPATRVPTPVRTGGVLPPATVPKRKLMAMNTLASLAGTAPKKKAKKRIGY